MESNSLNEYQQKAFEVFKHTFLSDGQSKSISAADLLDLAYELIDNEADKLFKWLNTTSEAVFFIEKAVEEFGIEGAYYEENFSFFHLLMLGQLYMYVFYMIKLVESLPFQRGGEE